MAVFFLLRRMLSFACRLLQVTMSWGGGGGGGVLPVDALAPLVILTRWDTHFL
jgi:hypothetical protein